ncbi:hypothetical protein [Anaeromyxobacter oryzisoli]|jgi:hypothetical protein|uniref:hypothetical protein n=1 Tax=Anaeromyxobacter oryzisoli TaxID=2925408 RepID=UPI001F5A9049|nr:hypothetical protein [Anaeromyxobacter sp. SG63]
MKRIESIHVAPTSETRALPGRFQSALQGAASGLARGLAATVQLAAPYVPGGTVLSAAVNGAVAGASGSARAGAPAGSSAPDDVLGATRQLQEEARTFNLQYLQLQENMQRESREFTALSNVMKVKHDSAKAAIQNIH